MKKYSPKIEAMRSREEILRQAMSTFQADPNPQIYRAMDEYAKEVAEKFSEWLQENRWFSFTNGKWHYTFEQGTAISERAYQNNYVKTSEQLFNQFLQSQSKNKNHAK